MNRQSQPLKFKNWSGAGLMVWLLSGSSSLFASGSAPDQEGMVNGQDEDMLALMALLDQETELATKTRMNADYVPGQATVIHELDARRSGLQTVADALNQVAGFFVSITNSGDKRIMVRGIGATQNANGLKMLVDGTPVNRGTDGSFDWVLRLPMEQIERIEVVRGPGSAIHGGSAFSGVVNVISRTDGFAGLSIGSRDLIQQDLGQRFELSDSAAVQLNLSHWQLGNSGLHTGPDVFPAQYSHSPGIVYDHEEGYWATASYSSKHHVLNSQYSSVERGPGYGQSGALPSESEPRQERYAALGYQGNWSLGDHLDLKLEAGVQYTRLQEAGYIAIPAGVMAPGGRLVAQDVFNVNTSEDRSFRGNVGLLWRLGERHQLYSQLSWQQFEVTDSSMVRRDSDGGLLNVREDSEQVEAGVSRQLFGMTLQDQWRFSESIDLTLGVRHDRYSDWGNHTSPRFAAVWRASDHHVFKTQFSEAYRPPTLSEDNPGPNSILYGEGDLTEEVIRTFETSYIYRRSDQRMSLTLFESTVKDLIEFSQIPGQPPRWVNQSDIETVGAELEWQYRPGRSWEWRFNGAYVQASDHMDDDDKLFGAANLFGNAGLVWHWGSYLSQSVSVFYMGQREGAEAGDSEDSSDDDSSEDETEERAQFDAYWLLNYAVTWHRPLGITGLEMALVGTNLTATEYRMPSSPGNFPQGLPMGTREYVVELEYQF